MFRFAWALTVLLAFSLGCKLVNEVNEVVTLATDVGALVTDIDLEGISTDFGGLVTDIDVEGLVTEIGGIATEIDLEAIGTEMESLSTEMESISTEMGGLFTDLPLFDETPGPVNTPNGFPGDIPLMTGAYDVSGTPTSMTFTVDEELTAVADYYRREMAARGWAEQPGSTGEGATELVFQQNTRRVRISIEEGFLFDVSVEITVEA
jgi:hypothetical protein